MCSVMDMSRKKKHINLALDRELLDRFAAWLASQEFPPSKTTVFEKLLRDFLDQREGE